jgi:phospholipase C
MHLMLPSATGPFHLLGLVDMGELFIKRIHEALCTGPQWNKMLFILTFDEHGGFGDHVPPLVNVPGDNLTWTEVAQDGRNVTFDFKRLGMHGPMIIMLLWVEHGTVEHYGINFGNEYTHTKLHKGWG